MEIARDLKLNLTDHNHKLSSVPEEIFEQSERDGGF